MIDAIRTQIRTGTPVAMAFGFALGITAGIALNSLYHASLILPAASSRLMMVVMLTSGGALAVALLMLPIEVIVAICGRAPRRRLYFDIACAAALFCFAALWMRFRVFHDPSSLTSVAAHLLLAAVLCTAIAFMHRSPGSSGAQPPSIPVLASIAIILAAAAGLSYRSLAGHAHPGRTPVLPANRHLPAATPLSNPPNIVLISIDTLRPDHTGCYGYSRPTTPNLDRIARESIVFRNATSPAPWTLPAHASLLTGLYPSSHGARFSSQHAPVIDKLDDSMVTLAESLASAGYETAAFTSVFWLSDKWGMLQGFKDRTSETALPAGAIVDRAARWLDRKQDRPFFLFLHFFDVHEFHSPPEFDARYQDPSYIGPLKDHPLRTSRNAYDRLSEADIRYLVAKYDGAINYVDEQLGRLLGLLNTGNTILLVVSDHGEEFLDHGGTGHGFTLYREVLQVPMILKLPDTPPAEVQIPVSLVDVAPTLLDYASVRTPVRLEGISLKPLLDTWEPPVHRRLFAEDTYFMNSAAIMNGEYKFIDNRIPPAELLNPRLFLVNLRCFFKFTAPELYNAKDDPAETRNLAGSDAERAEVLRNQLAAHVKIQNVGEQDRLEEETLEQMKSVGYVQ